MDVVLKVSLSHLEQLSPAFQHLVYFPPVLITICNDIVYLFTCLNLSHLKVISRRQEPNLWSCSLLSYNYLLLNNFAEWISEWINMCYLGGMHLCPENFLRDSKSLYTRIQWAQGEVGLLKKEKNVKMPWFLVLISKKEISPFYSPVWQWKMNSVPW